MDPLSVLSLVEACAGLGVTAGKLAIGLKSLADNYRSAALTFRSLSSQCKLFATAVRAIQAWMEEVPDTSQIDNGIWEQLADSLECANDAIYALENELVNTSKSSINTFWEKVNVIWNVDGLKTLEDCIFKQVAGLGVILQIMNLPTRQHQTDKLVEQSSVFQESRSSAMSVRDGDTSTIRRGGPDASTMRAPSTIMTSLSQMPQFDFEEMLLTSQVYLRNRNKTLALHSTSSKPGKMQDIGVSVSAWDLPLQPLDSNSPDLRRRAERLRNSSKEDLLSWVENDMLLRHEGLQAKYSKVKRYYFKSGSIIKDLEEDIQRLKAEHPSNRSQVELHEHGAAIEVPDIAQLIQERASLKKQLTTLRDEGKNELKENSKLFKGCRTRWSGIRYSWHTGIKAPAVRMAVSPAVPLPTLVRLHRAMQSGRTFLCTTFKSSVPMLA